MQNIEFGGDSIPSIAEGLLVGVQGTSETSLTALRRQAQAIKEYLVPELASLQTSQGTVS